MKRILAFFSRLFNRRGYLSVILTREMYPGTSLPTTQATHYDSRWSKTEPMGFNNYPFNGSRLVNWLATIHATFDAIRIAWRDGFASVSIESRL